MTGGWRAVTPADTSQISFADSPAVDSFGRLRASNPEGLFDGQFTYNLIPLQYEQITSGSGATIAHDPTNRCATLTLSSSPANSRVYMQSYEYVRYQPGKSQLALITFNFIEAKANVLKFVGTSDWGSMGSGIGNGIEFQLNGTTKQFTIYSDTSRGDETVTQPNWNLDRLDGTGPSRLTLDITKVQILVLDFQALYVGRVRMGFDIDGRIVYAHEFLHANLDAFPYVQNASFPIRCGMTCSATASTTMRFICSSMISEGGQENISARTFCAHNLAVSVGNGVDTHAISVRPKTGFMGFTNRVWFELDSVDIMAGSNTPLLWSLCIGQAMTGITGFTDVNTAHSAFEYNISGTAVGLPEEVVMGGFVSATNQAREAVSHAINTRMPITLSSSGTQRPNGTLTLLVQGIGGTATCYAAFNWREPR